MLPCTWRCRRARRLAAGRIVEMEGRVGGWLCRFAAGSAGKRKGCGGSVHVSQRKRDDAPPCLICDDQMAADPHAARIARTHPQEVLGDAVDVPGVYKAVECRVRRRSRLRRPSTSRMRTGSLPEMRTRQLLVARTFRYGAVLSRLEWVAMPPVAHRTFPSSPFVSCGPVPIVLFDAVVVVMRWHVALALSGGV